jgi:hypothetical protein
MCEQMRVLQIDYRRFRGFDELQIKPARHVVLIGEARAGRTDALEGLSRALGGDLRGLPEPDELDFHMRDTSRRAEVEAVLTDLGPELEQQFFDHLEFWNIEDGLVDELDSPEELDGDAVLAAVRLCYRIEWDQGGGSARHWVDFRRAPILTRVPSAASPVSSGMRFLS